MDKNSVKKFVIHFEIAVIKELYKNKKIGEPEYIKTIKKLEKENEEIMIDEKLIPSVIDIKI